MTSWRGGKAVDWTNAITLAGVFIGAATAAYVGYSKRWPAKPDNPILTGIALGYGDKEQTERLITEVRGCRIALEALADKQRSEMEELHRSLLDRMDAQERREEQEEQRPRRPAPRRRAR